MNKQLKLNRDGTIKSRGITWTDATWNPIGGCQHGCKWLMPDKSIAECYAGGVANRLAQAVYPQGFEHHYWRPEALQEPASVKQPSRIFVGSMSDVFGHWVPEEQIQAVLDVCRANPRHTFQFLTKNAPRLLQFNFPPNCWIGVSAPLTFMFGKRLDQGQQVRFFDRACDILDSVRASVRWISFEPLSFDVARLFDIQAPSIEWAVIGAASNGKTFYQPEPVWVKHLVHFLDGNSIPVFYKENLRGNAGLDSWREEYPNGATMPLTTVV